MPREFYLPSASEVAPKLLGHFLLRRTRAGHVGGPIVETEAYLRGDPACHAFCGPTQRNRSMWGPPGRAYIYLIYGNHFCFNAVCLPEGEAEAVLVRAFEPCWGVEWMKKNRHRHDPVELSNGPGKLCQALDVGLKFDGVDLCASDSSLIIARNPELENFLEERGPVVQTTRIGLTKGADDPLRFYLRGSKSVSRKVRENERR